MSRFTFLLITIVLSNPSFAVEEVTYANLLESNIINVDKVEIGMSIEEVENIMGSFLSRYKGNVIKNPWKEETYENVTYYHYLTSKHPPFVPLLANQATPIIFRDGKVIGKGRGLLKQIRNNEMANQNSNPQEKTVESRLLKLKSLLDKGIITKEDFEKQKTRILSDL